MERRPVGLAWVRRFITETGHIRRYGFALLPEARGRGLARAISREVITSIFADYPETLTLVAMVWGTNPGEGWKPTREGRRQPAGALRGRARRRGSRRGLFTRLADYPPRVGVWRGRRVTPWSWLPQAPFSSPLVAQDTPGA